MNDPRIAVIPGIDPAGLWVRIAVVGVAAVGVAVLAGWILDLPVLRSFGAGTSEMKCNAAVAFLVAAGSLWALRRADLPVRTRRMGRAGGVTAAAIGGLTLVEWTTGRSLGIDQLLVRDRADASYTTVPGRMAPNTALNLLCAGLALALIDVRIGRSRPMQWLCMGVLAMALLGLLVFAYGVEDVYQRLGFTPMAAHTAATFLVLSSAILWARRDQGVVAVIAGRTAAGFVTRRILPACIVLPLLIAWACLWAIRELGVPPGVGFAGFAVATVAMIAAVALRSGGIADALERRRLAAELERDRLFDLSIDLQGIAGMDGAFRRVNPAFTRVLGWPAEALVSRPFLDFVHPDDRERTIAATTGLAAGRPSTDFENRYRCHDGSYRWLSWQAHPDAATGSIYATARDITGRKTMEEALLRSNRELKEFAHVASHDLQEPLRMVSSYCAMLSESYRGRLSPDADEMIGLAVDGAKRMQVLIQDLLAYAKVEHQPQELSPLPLRQAVDDALQALAGALAESGAEVVVGDLPVVRADRRLMAQLLQNLLSNALKYRGAAPPRIVIDARLAGAAWDVGVTDNGIGIEPRHHARLFRMFKRLHGRDRYPGNGIGLAICKKIVELHGGAIRVESAAGQGSAFRFTVAAADAAPRVAASMPASAGMSA